MLVYNYLIIIEFFETEIFFFIFPAFFFDVVLLKGVSLPTLYSAI